MAAEFRCKIPICVAQVNPALHTHQLFDMHYRESLDSAIDEFLLRLNFINKLAPSPSAFDSLQGQLVLLGAIAAVESYLRTLFRRLIAVDPVCQNSVHGRDVSFGAAIHLPKEMMAEAVLERISFISEKNINEALRELLAVKGNLPADLILATKDYVRVCQLRHCAVHRFGKLGVSNAISLGLDDHKTLLEKPLKLDYASLQNSIAIATGFVKTVNNFLFMEVVSRIPSNSWTGVYRNDKRLFIQYYKLFADKVSSNKSQAPGLLYKQLMKQRTLFAKGIKF